MASPQIPVQFNSGAFVPTTAIYDVDQIYSLDVKSPEFKELIVRMNQNLNLMAQVLNVKDTGYYVRNEFLTGGLLFPNPNLSGAQPQGQNLRQIFRVTVDVEMPAAGTTTTPHNITMNSAFTFVAIYGAASLPCTYNVPLTGSYIPLPYVSASAITDNIQVDVDNTNVYITTGGFDYSGYSGRVTLEYVKN